MDGFGVNQLCETPSGIDGWNVKNPHGGDEVWAFFFRKLHTLGSICPATRGVEYIFGIPGGLHAVRKLLPIIARRIQAK